MAFDAERDFARGRAARIVALAARIDITVVFHVHRAPPQIVIRVFPLLGRVRGIGPHRIGFASVDAHVVHTGDGLPNAGECGGFVPVALHANHLDGHFIFEGPPCLRQAK